MSLVTFFFSNSSYTQPMKDNKISIKFRFREYICMYTFMYQFMIDFILISIKWTILTYSNHDFTNRGVLLGRKCKQRWHTMFQIGDGNGFGVGCCLSFQYLIVIYLVYVVNIYVCYKKWCSKTHNYPPPQKKIKLKKNQTNQTNKQKRTTTQEIWPCNQNMFILVNTFDQA